MNGNGTKRAFFRILNRARQAQSELSCPESLQDQLLSSKNNNNKINKRHWRRYEQRKENHVSIRKQFINSGVLRFGAWQAPRLWNAHSTAASGGAALTPHVPPVPLASDPHGSWELQTRTRKSLRTVPSALEVPNKYLIPIILFFF